MGYIALIKGSYIAGPCTILTHLKPFCLEFHEEQTVFKRTTLLV